MRGECGVRGGLLGRRGRGAVKPPSLPPTPPGSNAAAAAESQMSVAAKNSWERILAVFSPVATGGSTSTGGRRGEGEEQLFVYKMDMIAVVIFNAGRFTVSRCVKAKRF